MPQGDDVYLTIGDSIPYVQYGVKAYQIVEAILNFGRESKQERAIRQLRERVTALEQFVVQLDDRLSELEVRVSQAENRARLRIIGQVHQLAFSDLSRDLDSHPGDAADIAAKAIDRLRTMYADEDLWLWTDIVGKRTDALDSWRPAPPHFKGVALSAFAVGVMVWALAAQQAIGSGKPQSTYRSEAEEILGWITTRPDWKTDSTPRSITERFRAAVNVEIIISTRYPNAAGNCEYSFVAVNDLDRTRNQIREVDIYFGSSPSTMCTADPRIAYGDEAILEDQTTQIMTLQKLEDAVSRIRNRGTLADPVVGVFGATRYGLTLFAVEPNGDLRRFEIDALDTLAEPPTVKPIGDVVGTGWQNFTEIFATRTRVLYAVSDNGAIDWYREDDVARGPDGWSGPVRVKQPPALIQIPGEWNRHVNGGDGVLYTVRASSGFGVLEPMRHSLLYAYHPGVDDGSVAFTDPSVVAARWTDYTTVFGGGAGVIYGIDASGDLYWHRHTAWPKPGDKLETAASRIGNGWNVFDRVIAFGRGFIAGIHPNGEMLLYRFHQWQTGLGPTGRPVWHGPIRVPGTHWRGFSTLIPAVDDAPTIVK